MVVRICTELRCGLPAEEVKKVTQGEVMDTQEVRWEHYARVAAHAAARAFVERLVLKGKRS